MPTNETTINGAKIRFCDLCGTGEADTINDAAVFWPPAGRRNWATLCQSCFAGDDCSYGAGHGQLIYAQTGQRIKGGINIER